MRNLFFQVPKALLQMEVSTREASEEQKSLMNGNLELVYGIQASLASIHDLTSGQLSDTVYGLLKDLVRVVT